MKMALPLTLSRGTFLTACGSSCASADCSVVAVELEFYLLDRQRDAEGYLQPPCAPGTDDRNTQSQVYSVDNLNHFADVLNDIDELAQLQLIPADGAVAEASPVSLKSTFTILITCWKPAMMRWH